MVIGKYIPDKGDIVLLDFDPQIGSEQKGYRPCVVVSNKTFNKFTKLAMVCPITNTIRDFPLHVNLKDSQKTTGTIKCEQLKSFDFIARKIKFVEKIDTETLDEVIDIIQGSIE